jgi:hypothetical protein
VPGERFARLWSDPRTSRQLRQIAVDQPGQMVALFLADAATLRKLTAGTAPVTDDFPRRISAQAAASRAEPLGWLMDADLGRERLQGSPWLGGILPQSLVAAGAKLVRERGMLDAALTPALRAVNSNLWGDLAELLAGDGPTTVPLWMLGSESRMGEIASRNAPADPLAAEHASIDALVKRRPPGSDVVQAPFAAMTPKAQVVTIFRHCLAGQQASARSLMAAIPAEQRSAEPYREFFAWAADACAGG